ncbi:hypothetical protein BBW65_03775 [Helicobacter enhydrae]|uniref:DUF306 domain-containing protein n=1 Tax=Helicobacter enhydrae TaxID=222136 RepID=A0A1B1U5D8_9HELI|nr:META domain-containing protein [Helicobacter enhydrae]ANV97970.1 hypothetical protein BBW65_03775 [Helicobacter enhydrae]
MQKYLYILLLLLGALFANEKYFLVAMNGKNIDGFNTPNKPYIEFEGNDFFGVGFCNSFFGNIQKRTIQDLATTMMACDVATMDLERELFATFQNATFIKSDNHTLIARSKAGVLKFKNAYAQ